MGWLLQTYPQARQEAAATQPSSTDRGVPSSVEERTTACCAFASFLNAESLSPGVKRISRSELPLFLWLGIGPAPAMHLGVLEGYDGKRRRAFQYLAGAPGSA